MSLKEITGRYVVTAQDASSPNQPVIWIAQSYAAVRESSKPEPMVLQLSAQQGGGNGDPVRDRAFCAGSPDWSNTTETQISVVCEYNVGASSNVFEADYRPGAYQLPVAGFVRVGVRLRQVFDPTDNGLILGVSVYPGQCPGQHPLTYSVPFDLLAGTTTASLTIPAKARAFEVEVATADEFYVYVSGAAQAERSYTGVLDSAGAYRPPWSPVMLPQTQDPSMTLDVDYELISSARCLTTFFLSP